LIDQNRSITQKEYRRHNFLGWQQRYDRVAKIISPPDLTKGKVINAPSHLIEATALRAVVMAKLKQDPLFFVDRIIP
jgi:aminoglycoside 3-N-acetyltransferase